MGGLQHLTLLGVKNEQNLRDFKYGFVGHEGTFRSARRSDLTVSDATVTHSDLPPLSMYVRALLEKDKKTRMIRQSYNNNAVLAT